MPTTPPMPMLLALGAVHHHLIRVEKRSKAGLICETSECRDVHQLACLLGYGASAVNPYTAFATLNDLLSRDELKNDTIRISDPAVAAKNYRSALEKGLLKIMSKDGHFHLGQLQRGRRPSMPSESILMSLTLPLPGRPRRSRALGFTKSPRKRWPVINGLFLPTQN